MAIKELDDIPETLSEKRQTYRRMIRKDIQEAIDKQIECFEFDGDYNYKYLAQYAREEARALFHSQYYIPAAKKVKPLISQKYNKKYVFGRSEWEYAERFIKIKSRKCKDRVHVYASIDFEFIDSFEEILYEDMDKKQQEILERESVRNGKGECSQWKKRAELKACKDML